MVTVPDTVDPLAGLATLTVGGVVSAVPPPTLTVTDGDVPTLPAASYALATREWEPLGLDAEFQARAQGAALLVAARPPSTHSSTRVTPTLSEAVTATFTEPETVAPLAGLLIETVGATVSALLT